MHPVEALREVYHDIRKPTSSRAVWLDLVDLMERTGITQMGKWTEEGSHLYRLVMDDNIFEAYIYYELKFGKDASQEEEKD